MDFDWLDAPFDLHQISPKEIEESCEDPFGIRLLPDADIAGEGNARYFNLGKSISGRGIFAIFWSDGKRIRCICAREMAVEEMTFYERKNQELS